ncbi:MAG: acyltransferase [Burkholderiaceae bacterium]|jgi:acetyltransferase-like isoleucine patch superfamily enzyme|nr:acyltransferase [Burkholderiaceae bacterium]
MSASFNPVLRLRAAVNRWRRRCWRALFFRMLFGERGTGDGQLLLARARISPATVIEHEENLWLADDVFIGHFNYIEASAGVRIGSGAQITNFVSIVSHSTHRSVRVAAALSGAADLDGAERAGDLRAPIEIGACCFIGPHSTLEAGARLGRACLVHSHSRVRGVFGDYAVIAGNPARVTGDVREQDARWLRQHPQYRDAYNRWLAGLPATADVADARKDEAP